ncbi:MAG: multifunctional CCA addition/repair protein [Pseudomonadota bacterium]|nr:multifunctional CCA addition/repair protein [Pseudomonadota bacterium]
MSTRDDMLPANARCYLVGGAVRDAMLNLEPNERDWVVLGVTPEQMQAAGFRPVGKDFPVFLHPRTQEEYALARTERKSGHGYKGFVFHTGPEVTLEQDLQRRDLTINAMARDDDGNLVDPCNGQADIAARKLRHVAAAFTEDPVRVLRIARFMARFAPLGFTVAEETMALLRQIVEAGEVDHLVPERIWQETQKALMSARPSAYFQTLQQCGALARVMPELAALHGVPQRADYHPEVDSLVHTLMCVDVAAAMNYTLPVRYSALVHDLGKALTPRSEWPSHRMHEQRGVPLVEVMSQRIRAPNECRELAVVHTREHLLIHRVRELRPQTLLDLLERAQAFRHADRFELLLQAACCDARGRLGFEDVAYPQADYLRAAREVASAIQARDLIAEGLAPGEGLGKEMQRRRVDALKVWRGTASAE